MKTILWIGARVSLLLMATLLISSPVSAIDSLPNEGFYQVLESLNTRTSEIARSRPYKIKGMNDSIAAMSKAMVAMAASVDVQVSKKWLDEAENAYIENCFVHLLRAIIFESQGLIKEADRSFESFLIHSRSYSEFEKPLLGWRDFQKLRRFIYHVLLARGVSFEGRESQIQIKIPFEGFISYLRQPEKEDELLNWFFVCILMIGIPVLIFAHFSEADFNGFWLSSFMRLYFTTWIAYAGWMLDLLLGFPFDLERVKAVILLYGIVFCLHIFLYFIKIASLKLRPLEDGYRRCQNCSEVFLKLIKECPRCRHCQDKIS